MPGGDIADRLAALVAHIMHGQVRAHFTQGVEQAGAQWIQQHAFDGDLRARDKQRRHQREGGRGWVAGHGDPRALQALSARQPDDPPRSLRAGRDLDAECLQHALGVVAGEFRLDHFHPTLGVQAGQQRGGFYLGRGHGQSIADALQAAAPQGRGKPPPGSAEVGRAHAGQGIEHPRHGPGPQRVVAIEGHRDRESGDGAHDQPRAGARVAAVDDPLGLLQRAAPQDAPAAVSQPLDLGPQRAHRIGRMQHIVALEQAFDVGPAMRHRAQDKGPMGDGFVARRPHAPPKRARGAAGQGRGVHGGGSSAGCSQGRVWF